MSQWPPKSIRLEQVQTSALSASIQTSITKYLCVWWKVKWVNDWYFKTNIIKVISYYHVIVSTAEFSIYSNLTILIFKMKEHFRLNWVKVISDTPKSIRPWLLLYLIGTARQFFQHCMNPSAISIEKKDDRGFLPGTTKTEVKSIIEFISILKMVSKF